MDAASIILDTKNYTIEYYAAVIASKAPDDDYAQTYTDILLNARQGPRYDRNREAIASHYDGPPPTTDALTQLKSLCRNHTHTLAMVFGE